jgi:hypothetical protein
MGGTPGKRVRGAELLVTQSKVREDVSRTATLRTLDQCRQVPTALIVEHVFDMMSGPEQHEHQPTELP